MTTESARRTEERKRTTKHELDELIEGAIRETWLPNTLAWIVTVGGAFLINLALLAAVAGR
jgi:hypothetical protein